MVWFSSHPLTCVWHQNYVCWQVISSFELPTTRKSHDNCGWIIIRQSPLVCWAIPVWCNNGSRKSSDSPNSHRAVMRARTWIILWVWLSSIVAECSVASVAWLLTSCKWQEALLDQVTFGPTGNLKSTLYSLAYVVDYDRHAHWDEQGNDDHGGDQPRSLRRGGTAEELELLAPAAFVVFITSDTRFELLLYNDCIFKQYILFQDSLTAIQSFGFVVQNTSFKVVELPLLCFQGVTGIQTVAW